MIQRKSYPAQFKAVTDGAAPGTFEAYVAIFGTPDRPDFFGESDIIEPGAFSDTLKSKGLPPLVWTHNWDIPPIGDVLEAEEDEKGLRIKAQLDLEDDGLSGQYARSIHRGMLASPPRVKEFSFAFDVQKFGIEKRDGREFRLLQQLELFEVGPTLVGRHPDTELVAAKALAAVAATPSVLTDLQRKRLSEIRLGLKRAGLKAGARNATKDQARIDDVHRLAVELGATCGSQGEE